MNKPNQKLPIYLKHEDKVNSGENYVKIFREYLIGYEGKYPTYQAEIAAFSCGKYKKKKSKNAFVNMLLYNDDE